MDPLSSIITALIGLGFPGIVIAGLCTCVVFLGKELLLSKKDHQETIKDLQQLRITDLQKILEEQHELSKDQNAAISRLADRIKG